MYVCMYVCIVYVRLETQLPWLCMSLGFVRHLLRRYIHTSYIHIYLHIDICIHTHTHTYLLLVHTQHVVTYIPTFRSLTHSLTHTLTHYTATHSRYYTHSLTPSMYVFVCVQMFDTYTLTGDKLNDVRAYGLILVTLLLMMALVGVGWVIKVHTYMHTYIYTCIHTRTYTHTYIHSY